MEKKYFFTLLMTLITAVSFGQVIIAEDFSYTDGSLVGNSTWENVSGTAGDLLVTSGQAVVQHGTPSEDVKITFAEVSGDIYVGFDFTVDDLGAPYSGGTDYEYFVHLGFKARMDIQAGTTGGDFTVGISSGGSTAEATLATDLTFGQTYRAIIKFDQVTGTAQLWISPAVSTDTSISGSGVGAFTIPSFDLRQSDSSENETIRVDDLMIGQTFNDVLVFAATASVKNNRIEGFATYPNPITNNTFTITSNSNSKKEFIIFNVLGKKVLSSSFSGVKSDVDVSTISSGVYILKVTEGGKTATKKLVIR
tara:strand:+ start:27577 stop:28500 length:924 start_codon:yes stop_codon:yes gene_type:complete